MDMIPLREAGMTDGEIKVYMALLEAGSSTTGSIVEKSGVSRSIVQQILEKLIKKGLSSYVTKEKTRHYQAAEPSKIIEYIEHRESELSKNKAKVEQILPQLMLMQKSAKQSEVSVYEGFKGAITAHEHIYSKLAKADEYYYMGIPQQQPKHFHAYWQRDHKRRVKAGIKCRLLFNTKTPPEVLINRNSYAGCDARYMSTQMNTPSTIMGYKDVTVISIPSGKPITLEIINAEIAASFKTYFEEFWKQSKTFVMNSSKDLNRAKEGK